MSYQMIINQNQKWIDQTFDKIDKKLKETAIKSRYKIPYSVKDGVHTDMAKSDITWWTNGFWGGLMWLMYDATKNPEYLLTAKECEKILLGSFEEIDGLHHDVGFMFHLTSGASYRLTGDKHSRRIFVFQNYYFIAFNDNSTCFTEKFIVFHKFISIYNFFVNIFLMCLIHFFS